jgi:hypothetical protein
MNKFIIYKENMNILDNFIYSIGNFLLTIFIGLTILYCIYNLYTLAFTEFINKKEIFTTIIKVIIAGSIVFGLNILFQTEKSKNYRSQFVEQTVQLKDIKELIHVEGNKLTIEPLTNKSDNYYYYDYQIYKNNERQLFRIDHDDVFEEYKLIDKNNNKIKISKEEYEKLTKGSEN